MIHKMQDYLIEAIAEFMTTGVAEKSIHNEMGKPYAAQWAKIVNYSGANGYSTKAEAIKHLRNVLL